MPRVRRARRAHRSVTTPVLVPRRRRWTLSRRTVLAALGAATLLLLVAALVARPIVYRLLADPARRGQVRHLVRSLRRPLSPRAITAWRDSVPASLATTASGVHRPALPRRLRYDTVRFHDPARGRTRRADDAAALQRALRDARPGDQILLRRGATYEGTFLLPERRDDDPRWITLRTDLGADSLPDAARMTGDAAQRLRLARLVVATNGRRPALGTDGRAVRWRVAEVEITAAPGLTELRDLVRLGDPDARDLRDYPFDLVLDRVWVHGLPDTPVRRCVHLASGATAVRHSTLEECHLDGFDSIAIGGWAGPGPYQILDNELAGAGMGILFGGATPGIDDLVPADIEIRGNHVARPDSWQGRRSVKNLVEFKSGRRILVEDNLLERNWADGQDGIAILLKSADQYGDAPWTGLSDVTIRRNVLRAAAGGLTIVGVEGPPSRGTARVAIEENLFYGVGAYRGTASGRMLFLQGGIADVIVARNTLLHAPGSTHALLLDGGHPSRGLEVTDNVMTLGTYGVWASEGGTGTGALDRAWPRSWTFRGNVLLAPSAAEAGAERYPEGARGIVELPTLPALLARLAAARTTAEARPVLDALRARTGSAGAPATLPALRDE